jgi:hypothetical protein
MQVSMLTDTENTARKIPHLLICFQTILFSILYTVWILPETILIRNVSLALGAFIGVYEIYVYRQRLISTKAIPLLLIGVLFIWAIFHLFFLANNFVLQFEEFRSVWKRSFMAALFALGWGLTIASCSPKVRRLNWAIAYVGFLMPAFIYLLKFILTQHDLKNGLEISGYWHLYQLTDHPSVFFVAKTAYMGFVAPAVAIALVQLYWRLKEGKLLTWESMVYVLTIPIALFIFFEENVKNGILYAFLFILIFMILSSLRSIKIAPIKTIALMGLCFLVSSIYITKHIEKNDSWNSLLADAKIAVQTDKYQNWKYDNQFGFPENEYGQKVSTTNYQRVAWGLSAAKLVIEHPLGYGLIERSFGQMGMALWPGSRLSQSHSGWLDLTLGIGVPGMLMVMGSLLGSLILLRKTVFSPSSYLAPWVCMAFSVLLCFLLIWSSTEISQKVFFEELIFFLTLAGALVVGISGLRVQFEN